MNKEKTIKIRMSDEDMELLEQCCQKFNMTISEVVRLGIKKTFNETKQNEERKVFMKKLIYAEKVERKGSGHEYSELYTWDYEEAKENIINLIGKDDGDIKEKEAEEILERVASGETVSLGTLYISTFSVATSDEIAKVATRRAFEDKELDKMTVPEATAFMNKLMSN